MFNSLFFLAGFVLSGAVTLADSSIYANTTNFNSYPHVAETGHATQDLVDIVDAYFSAKNIKIPSAWAAFFDPTKAVYGDVGSGGLYGGTVLPSKIALLESFWAPASRSYPLRILGDTNSAVVYMVDTPDMFGDEIRIIAALNFANGVILREVDYWDVRGSSKLAASRVPASQYPKDFNESVITTAPNPAIKAVVDPLTKAFAAKDATTAGGLFAFNAVLEDLSLRTRIEGAHAITKYLQRGLSTLPWGSGSVVRNILGNAQGGGYEWADKQSRPGIVALELDPSGLITKMTTVWDSYSKTNSSMAALAQLSIER